MLKLTFAVVWAAEVSMLETLDKNTTISKQINCRKIRNNGITSFNVLIYVKSTAMVLH